MKEALCKAALTALEKAMEVERHGKAFYEQAAELVHDPMGKQVFQTLARDEVQHIRLLQAEYDSIQKEKDWMALDEAKVCVPGTSLQVFPDKSEASLIIRKKATDLDALKLAMEFE